MELTFQKSADRWIAEFEAHADFAIHIEGVLEGNVQLLQRHPAHGMYAVVSDSIKRSSYVNVYDYEVPVLIAPVFIKVSCASEPTFAEVVSNGEVTEIKAQSKEIEVTSNGTMDITPDAGFAYLSAVKVKTNVAGSGEGSASSVEYIDVSGDFDGDFHKSILVSVASQIRAMTEYAGLCVASYANIKSNIGLADVVEVAQAISIDNSTPLVIGGNKMLISDYLNAVLPQIGLSIERYNALPRITKEEFYNIA